MDAITFIGTATTIVRLGSFTVLTDPNFLHHGQRAYLGKGLWSRRLTEPAMQPADLPALNAVVLSLAPLSSGEGKAGGLVVEQGLKDGIGEAALEYAKCLASAVPTALAPFDHPFGRRMPTGLGECDAV
jgi:hypothetical protein